MQSMVCQVKSQEVQIFTSFMTTMAGNKLYMHTYTYILYTLLHFVKFRFSSEIALQAQSLHHI
jgi:hypothetical protein